MRLRVLPLIQAVDWEALDDSIGSLLKKYTILSSIDVQSILAQIKDLSSQIELGSSVTNYLHLFYRGEWKANFEVSIWFPRCICHTL